MMRKHRTPRSFGEGGFTLVEFMVAMAITTTVLGATVLLATQIQKTYTLQLDDAAVEQEIRYAADWITRYLRSAGSDAYDTCFPTTTVPFIWFDPNGNGADDDVRIQADIAEPPDGDCVDPEEDVTIALDAVNKVITLDIGDGAGAVTMTDPVIQNLEFTFLDSSRTVTASDAAVTYIQVRVTGLSDVRDNTGNATTTILETEVRLRAR